MFVKHAYIDRDTVWRHVDRWHTLPGVSIYQGPKFVNHAYIDHDTVWRHVDRWQTLPGVSIYQGPMFAIQGADAHLIWP